MKPHFCESLWCKAWQLGWKLQQTVVCWEIWDDFASMTYARHMAECKWLWVGANYFSPTFIPNHLTQFPTSKRNGNLLESSPSNTLDVRVVFFWTHAHENQPSPPLTLCVGQCVCWRKVLKGDFLSTPHNLHWSHGHNLLAVFTVLCGRESFTQHNVGGCPRVSVCSICVGCLLGSALLWTGHWRARAPRMGEMQADADWWVQSARRQARYQRLQIGIWKGLSSAAVFQRVRLSPLPWPLTPPSVCLHLIPWVGCCEWTK